MTTAEQLWELFAGQIAGDVDATGKVAARVWRSGGYRDRRRLAARPAQPAAVLLYDRIGRTRCLALDFDAKGEDGASLAAGEALACAEMVRAAGGRAVIDRSATGGRHVYIPLQRPKSIDQVRAVMVGLSGSFRTLDKTPMVNATTGAIRPPGAAHPLGHWQQLITPLDDARITFRVRNSDAVWSRLCAAIGPVDLVPGVRRPLTVPSTTRWRGRRRDLRDAYEAIARTGVWDRRRHPRWTASEARQAVLAAAYNAGWLLPEVQALMQPGGAWCGLRRLYRNRDITTLLPWEWGRAEALVARPSEVTVRRSLTREHSHAPEPSPPHSEYAWLREWWTAMRLAERHRYASRSGHSLRLVLRALAAAAQRRGSRYVAFGCRSLALSCGLDSTTVARALRELREEADPLIDLVESDRGHDRADIYALRIPDEYAGQARRAPWRVGRLEAIHPAFLDLGTPAAFVYEALGERRDPLMTVDVADVALLGRTAATQALKTLAEMGLAERSPAGWRRGSADLDAIAVAIGARDEFDRRVERYRDQRDKYREKLGQGLVRRADAVVVGEPPVDDWASAESAQPDAEDHVIELPASAAERQVAEILGAELLYVGPGP